VSLPYYKEKSRGVSSMGDDLVVKKLLMSSVVGEFSNLMNSKSVIDIWAFDCGLGSG
jgi:hypothetical protein